jgi:hypothetical protein
MQSKYLYLLEAAVPFPAPVEDAVAVEAPLVVVFAVEVVFPPAADVPFAEAV